MPEGKIRIGRQTIGISKPDKLLFPDDGITKSDLVDYYDTIAGTMLPHVRDRLMTLERYPDGIDGEKFFSKEIPRHFPSWIGRKKVKKERGTVTHVVARDRATIVYLANQACITTHVGLSRTDRLDHPDQLIFDLDPAGSGFAQVRKTAVVIRELLEELGLVPWVKTSGSKGLHVLVSLPRKEPFDEVRKFARDLARLVAARDPKHVTVEGRKEKRRGRLFLDWLRNSYGQHAVAPYGVRARPGAPVAMPIDWDEVEDSKLSARRYSMKEAVRKVEADGDAWKGIRRRARSLAGPRRRLDDMLSEER